MTGLCMTRPSDWWDTGDDGNRLALLLCRVCPERNGAECAAGMPDPRPHGVIRAGVAYTERGKVAPLCSCGYPDDKVPDARRTTTLCRRCLPALPRAWRQDRRRYWAEYYRRRKAERASERGRDLADPAVGVVAADAADVLAGVAGELHDVGLSSAVNEDRVTDRVGQLPAPLVQRGLRAAVCADGVCDRVVTHGSSVTDIRVAKQGLPSTRRNTPP